MRAEFPILDQEVNGHLLVYLDNGATSQKPRQVIDALRRYYEADNANVHRGLHALSERATNDYEGARDTVRAFLNAADRREIVFVRGATEGLNLVAQGWARPLSPTPHRRPAMLEIRDFRVAVDGKDILTGLGLHIAPGEVYAIMGPNGSGKSTLAHVLAGRDGYEVTGGEILFEGRPLLDLAPEERACAGLFLAFRTRSRSPG